MTTKITKNMLEDGVLSPIELTTTELINSTLTLEVGGYFRTTGYAAAGDGGAGDWVFEGVTGQIPSQSPADLGTAKLTDAVGNEWVLSGARVSSYQMGAFDGASAYLELQALFNLDRPIHVASGVYLASNLVIKKECTDITWDNEAVIKADADGDFIVKVDGYNPTGEESATRFNIERIQVDGNTRGFTIDGVWLSYVIRSGLGSIYANLVKGRGVAIVDVVKEVTIDTIRTKRCGSTASIDSYIPAFDILQDNIDVGDATNNITIYNLQGIYNRGPDIRIDNTIVASPIPRKIYINNYFLHGNIPTSDNPLPDVLTPAERDLRLIADIRTSEDVVFGTGALVFGGNNVPLIRIADGSTGTVGNVTFESLLLGQRYSHFDTTPTNNKGIQQTAGRLNIKNFVGQSGFTGFNVLSSEGGECNVDWNTFEISTGSVLVTNIATVTSYSTDYNLNNRKLSGVSQIIGGNTTSSIREGASGNDLAAAEIRYLPTANRGTLNTKSIHEFSQIVLPTAPSLITDSVDSALAFDGSNLRFFDGATWKTVTVV